MDSLPSSAVDPLASECALAAIGLQDILDGEPDWSATTRHVAANIPKSIRKSLADLMTGGDRPEPNDLPKYDHDKVSKQLADGPQVKQAEALQRAIPNANLAMAVAAQATRLVHMLQPQFPRPTRTSSVAGLRPVPSTGTTERNFGRVWSVACDPLVVFRDLLEGCLTTFQARALESLYPNLYELTLTMVDQVYASLKAKRPKFELTRAVDRQLGVLKGMADNSANLPLAAQFQAVAGTNKPVPPPTKSPMSVKTDLSLPGQDSSAGAAGQ